MNRKYDIIVFGATGFTGRKVAEYLARNAPPTIRWAIAGRNAHKLEALKVALGALGPSCRKLEVVEAAVEDAAALDRMAAQTRILVTTVGAFREHGESVARACVANQTDYIDSTGEPQFVQMLIDRYSDEGRRRGVRIIPSCGFYSIPADLGVLFTIMHLPSDRPIHLCGYLWLKATFSGGTQRSAVKSLDQPKESFLLRAATPHSGRRVRLETKTIQRRADLQGWTAPILGIDASIVMRSAASIERYGPDFTYSHNMVHSSWLGAAMASFALGLLMLLARFAPLRALLVRLLPKSGEGPTEEQMRRNWFKFRFIAECGGEVLRTEVSGGDPGYLETSKMLAEAALCLAEDRASLPHRAGVLTPAEAMGELLVARLQRVGLRFEVL